MPFVPRRVLIASALSAGIVVTTLGATNADAAIGQGSPPNAKLPTQNVIVVLRNQHTDLSMTKGQQRGPRIDAAQRDQAPLIANAQRSGARNIHGFKTLNGFSATVTPDQAAQLSADPSV